MNRWNICLDDNVLDIQFPQVHQFLDARRAWSIKATRREIPALGNKRKGLNDPKCNPSILNVLTMLRIIKLEKMVEIWLDYVQENELLWVFDREGITYIWVMTEVPLTRSQVRPGHGRGRQGSPDQHFNISLFLLYCNSSFFTFAIMSTETYREIINALSVMLFILWPLEFCYYAYSE